MLWNLNFIYRSDALKSLKATRRLRATNETFLLPENLSSFNKTFLKKSLVFAKRRGYGNQIFSAKFELPFFNWQSLSLKHIITNLIWTTYFFVLKKVKNLAHCSVVICQMPSKIERDIVIDWYRRQKGNQEFSYSISSFSPLLFYKVCYIGMSGFIRVPRFLVPFFSRSCSLALKSSTFLIENIIIWVKTSSFFTQLIIFSPNFSFWMKKSVVWFFYDNLRASEREQ